MNIIYQDWFVIPAVGICAFILCFIWNEKIINWLKYRSLGQREEVIKLMQIMFIEVDEKKITMTMLLCSFGLGFLVFLACWPNLILGFLFGSVVTVFGWSIPKLVMRNLYEKRCNKFVEQMVDGLTLMANGIKAGLSPAQSMERVRANLQAPISQEFGHMLKSINLGQRQQEALNELAQRIPRPDVLMFTTAINILDETGGNMGETFQTIVGTIRERQKVERKIEALTAQSMMQGMIITMVPFIMLLVFWLTDPAYIRPLFNTVPGIFALIVMLVLQIIGGLMIKKIVKINV